MILAQASRFDRWVSEGWSACSAGSSPHRTAPGHHPLVLRSLQCRLIAELRAGRAEVPRASCSHRRAINRKILTSMPCWFPKAARSSRLAEFGNRGMSFNICRGTLGSLAMFTMIPIIGSVRSTSSAISLFFCAERGFDGFHHGLILIQRAIISDLLRIWPNSSHIDHCGAAFAAVIAAEPQCDRFRGDQSASQKLPAGNLCNIHRHLRVRGYGQEERQQRSRQKS
jgi:hypothetical protein